MVVWKAPDVLRSEIAISAEHFMQMQTNDKCRKQVRNMAKKGSETNEKRIEPQFEKKTKPNQEELPNNENNS